MEDEKMIHNALIRYIWVWVGSLLYYNAIECFLIADVFRHSDWGRIPFMNMKLAFIIYPIIVYLVCCFNQIQSRPIRITLQSVLCILYSSVVIYINMTKFPTKTWAIVAISISCIVICILIDKKINTIIHIDDIKQVNSFLYQLFCFIILIAIICTAFCHSYIV